jgi:hypothetical protein
MTHTDYHIRYNPSLHGWIERYGEPIHVIVPAENMPQARNWLEHNRSTAFLTGDDYGDWDVWLFKMPRTEAAMFKLRFG